MVPLEGCLISQPWVLHLMTKPRSINPLNGTMGSTACSVRMVPVKACCFSSTDPCANSTTTGSASASSFGVPLLKAFVAPPSKRPVGPSGAFTLLILTALATGLRVFRRVVASLNSPVTLSGVLSPPSPVSGPVLYAVSDPRGFSAAATSPVVFSGLLCSPIPFPYFSGVPFPLGFDTLATLFLVGSCLGSDPVFFKGQSRFE